MSVHEKFVRHINDKNKAQNAFIELVTDMVATRQISTVARDAVGRVYSYDKLKNPPEVRYEYSSNTGRC